MSFQSSDPNQNLYLFKDSLFFINSSLRDDMNWRTKLKGIVSNFEPDCSLPLNRTVVFSNFNSMYALKMWNNITAVTVLKASSAEEFISNINTILEYLVSTLKTLKIVRLVNECNFKLFVYAPAGVDIPNFIKTDSQTTVFGENKNGMVEWKRRLIFDSNFNLQLQRPTFGGTAGVTNSFGGSSFGFGSGFGSTNSQSPQIQQPNTFGTAFGSSFGGLKNQFLPGNKYNFGSPSLFKK